MITEAGNLPAGAVIHTVGPIWADHDLEENQRLLASCYENSLDLAAENGCRSVAFPNISTGVYGYPKREAAVVAVGTVEDWMADNGTVDEVVFVCFDAENKSIYSDLVES